MTLTHCIKITGITIICLSTNRWRPCAKTEFVHGAAVCKFATYSFVSEGFFFQVFEGERSRSSRLILPRSLFRLCLNQFTNQPLRLWARHRRSRAPCQSLAAFHTSDRSLVTVHRRKERHFIDKGVFLACFIAEFSDANTTFEALK